MEKYFEEWNRRKFPVRVIQLPKELGGFETKIADVELWLAIEYACDHESHVRHSEAVDLDREIYYYCDSRFIASDPTDKEIFEYLIKHGC